MAGLTDRMLRAQRLRNRHFMTSFFDGKAKIFWPKRQFFRLIARWAKPLFALIFGNDERTSSNIRQLARNATAIGN
jgi:hypothetical protein